MSRSINGWDQGTWGTVCAVDGPALCRMFNQAISGQGLPTRLSTDHDPLFRFHRWQANLRILDVETVQTVPLVPWSHPFIERLIATLRHEYLDSVLLDRRRLGAETGVVEKLLQRGSRASRSIWRHA